MHVAGKMFRSLQFAFNERLVDDHLSSDVRQLTSLPRFHLLSHRLKVSLHSIDANRDTVNELKGLRVHDEDRGKRPRNNVSELTLVRNEWSQRVPTGACQGELIR